MRVTMTSPLSFRVRSGSTILRRHNGPNGIVRRRRRRRGVEIAVHKEFHESGNHCCCFWKRTQYVGLLLGRFREHNDKAVFLRLLPTIRAYQDRHRGRQSRQRDGKETHGNGNSDALRRACAKLISRVEKSENDSFTLVWWLLWLNK